MQVVGACLNVLRSTNSELMCHNELSACGACGEVSRPRGGDPKWVRHVGVSLRLRGWGNRCGSGTSNGWSRGARVGTIGASGNAQRRKRGNEWGGRGVAFSGRPQRGSTWPEGGWGTRGTSGSAGRCKASGSALGSGAATRGLVWGWSGGRGARVAGLTNPDTPEAPNVGDNA